MSWDFYGDIWLLNINCSQKYNWLKILLTALLPSLFCEGCCHPKNKCILPKHQKLTTNNSRILLFRLLFNSEFLKSISNRRDWLFFSLSKLFEGAPDWLNNNISGSQFNILVNYNLNTMIASMMPAKWLKYSIKLNGILISSWISCIDKSIIDWLNKYCPGWICVPRKPNSFGSKYHIICSNDLIRGDPFMFLWAYEGKR